ncbi:MAG TPA: FecR domain-containing protein [Puia sp.]|jgi:ferric-dicitrate binding protein FerR (iron transport regulator)|nr:FecR domain-containing protein [Puia sp.]
MSKDYLEPEDLLTDESFLSWYFGPGRETDGFWNVWAAGSPVRKTLLARTVALMEVTRIREKALPGEKVDLATTGLLERIGGLGAQPAAVRRVFRRRMWVAAACILVVVTGGITAIRMPTNRPQRLATAFGEVTLRTLPDGSEVTMNANSRLTLSSHWKDGADREVWLDGEAFFHVEKTPEKSRFIVHTDRFDVIVTGTQFNVVNRRGKDNVMLREGRVIVHPLAGSDLAMVPGDFVQWNGKGLERDGIKSDSLLAWKQHQLLFDKTPLKDVVGIIKDQYGVQIELEDQSIGDSTITGIVRNDNLDVFLQALESTSDYEVIRKEGKIAIKASVKP